MDESETGNPNEKIHKFLVADILLWRKKEIPIAILSISSFVWIFVDLIGFHFTTLLFNLLCVTFSVMYWNNIPIPKVRLPEAQFIEVSLFLHSVSLRVLLVLRELAVNTDYKHMKLHMMVFVGHMVIALSVVLLGSLTFIYVVILMLLTVPISFENYKKRSGEVGEPVVGF